MSIQESTSVERAARLLLTAVGFLLVLIGQVVFYLSPEDPANGANLGLILSLAGAIIVLVVLVYGPPHWATRLAARLSLSTANVLVIMAVLLAVMAASSEVIFEQLGRVNYLPVLILWVLSALVYVGAFVGDHPDRMGIRTWFAGHRRELLLIGLVTLLAAGLRFYQLGNIPRVIDGDEGRIGQAALQTNQNPLANPFALFENFGGIYIQAIGLALSAFGHTPFALRLLPAIVGTAAIPAVYLLGRRLLGAGAGLVAAILLAIGHAAIHFSRIVSVAYIPETALIPLELYFLFSGLQDRRPWRLAVGGLILGVHFGIYVSAQVIFAMLVVYLIAAAFLARPLLQRAGRMIWVFWLGVLVAGLPEAVYVWRHPSEFLSRLNADGTFQSGWLSNQLAATGQSAPAILLGRIAHALLSLNHLPAVDFYNSRVPLLDILTSTLLIVGLVYALWRTRDTAYLLLNGYFWSLTLGIAIFAVPPSADSYRMLVVLPAAMLLAASGLKQAYVALSLARPDQRWVQLTTAGCLLVAVLALNVRAYFVDFASQCRYGGDRATRFASYLGSYLNKIDPEATIYLLSDDELRYGTHTSVDFLSGNRPVTNWTAPVDQLKMTADTVVLAGPTRAQELRDWAEAQAGGQLVQELDCAQPMLLAYQPAQLP
jgi:4-amino-4-deoxy-L-arabinose transferase-like glycosyltransferase